MLTIIRRIYPALPAFTPRDRAALLSFTPQRWAEYIVSESDFRRAHRKRELVHCIGLVMAGTVAMGLVLWVYILASMASFPIAG